MHPEEETRPERIEQRERRIDDAVRPALGPARAAGHAFAQPVVVEIEAAREPIAAIEHQRADDRAGRVARLLQAFGQRGDRVGQPEDLVVPHAVAGRIEGRHQRGVRRQRQRRRGDRGLEANSGGRQRV